MNDIKYIDLSWECEECTDKLIEHHFIGEHIISCSSNLKYFTHKGKVYNNAEKKEDNWKSPFEPGCICETCNQSYEDHRFTYDNVILVYGTKTVRTLCPRKSYGNPIDLTFWTFNNYMYLPNDTQHRKLIPELIEKANNQFNQQTGVASSFVSPPTAIIEIPQWKIIRDSSIREGECACGILKNLCAYHS